jgi:hypothetical protein
VKPVDSHNGSDIARVADGVEPPTTAVRVWRWVTAAVALSQLAAPRIADALAGDFLPSGATNEATITPSGYAFSIWGLLCVLCVVTAAAIVRFGLGAAREIGPLVEASLVFSASAPGWWSPPETGCGPASQCSRHGGRVDQDHPTAAAPRRRHDLSPLADPAGDHHLRPVSGLAPRRGVRPCRAALVFGGWSPDQTAWQAVSLVAATAAAVALTVFLRGTPG